MKHKIVHIVFDDKFIDGAISLFEIDDKVENTYIIIGERRDLRYIKYSAIQYIQKNRAIDFINQFDAAIIHSLPAIPIDLIGCIRSGVKVVWFAWGYDIYEKPYDLIPIKLYGPKTHTALSYERVRSRFNIGSIRSKLVMGKQVHAALKRIDYFSGVFPYELGLIKQFHPEFVAKPLDFYYGSKDFFVPEEPSQTIIHNKKNVLIGNSGDPSNNHLDVLKAINSVTLSIESKIIIPLSYCGTPRYIHKVETTAESTFPDQVFALRHYLPLDEYIDLISNCRTAVFAHERQQASDNIFMQLLYGARVYMSESSMAYDYLKSIGLKVYSLQNDLSLFNIEMSDEDVLMNRKLLSELYSSSKLIERVKKINEIILELK